MQLKDIPQGATFRCTVPEGGKGTTTREGNALYKEYTPEGEVQRYHIYRNSVYDGQSMPTPHHYWELCDINGDTNPLFKL